MIVDRMLPANTPIADASTRADDDARKTVNLLVSLSVAKSRVANWVLSPISARKIDTKIITNVLISIFIINGIDSARQ